jgi:hypothetical protein
MHSAETYTSGFAGAKFTAWRNSVLKYTIKPKWSIPQAQVGGESLSAYRSASVHTSPDKYGWRQPTGYSAYRHTEDRPFCNYSFRNGSYSFEGKSYCFTIPAPAAANAALFSQLQAEAETLCLAKFATGSVDLSVAFLERKQTANMVTDWCKATTRLLRDLRKGRWVTHSKTKTTKTWKWDKNVPRGWTPEALKQWRAGKPVTAVKNAWLTTRYGIAPSLMDIAGSVEAISNADNGTFDRYIATNHSRRFDVESGQTSPASTYFGAYYTLPITLGYSTYRKHEVSVRLDATIDNSFYLSLQDVGLTNPLLTGWEVTPYSFVLDWFVGVGDFLSAINAWNTGYKFKAGSVTKYYDLSYHSNVAVRYGVPGCTDPKLSMPYPARHRKTGFTRGVYSTSPVPSIVVKRDPLNFERMWDSIFLLSNVLGDKKNATKAKGRMRGLRI